jgi:hypothetical protein
MQMRPAAMPSRDIALRDLLKIGGLRAYVSKLKLKQGKP